MTQASDLIAKERERQIAQEGWTPEHDDSHDGNELYDAAICYLWHGTEKAGEIDADGTPARWPWEARWWKPRDRHWNLVRAGALLVAEKDRRLRANIFTGDVDDLIAVVEKEIEALAA